jgi:hypothetical protein
MNNELERPRKENVLAKVEVPSRHILEGTEEMYE